LTVVAAIRKQRAAEFLYVGRADSIEKRLARNAQIAFEVIETGQVRGKAPWIAARSLWRIVQSVGKVRALICRFKPTVIFATGGYVSAPVIWAGAAEKIPSVIYLPDLEPGWAIRATAWWATRVAVSFPEVEQHFAPGKAVTTGYPVREEFFKAKKANARARYHLDPHAPALAIFGGSAGAHRINRVAVANLVRLSQLAQVIHFTGRNDEFWVNAEVAQLSTDLRSRVRVFGYLDDDLPHVLVAADLVVARAGAGALAELPALGLPAVLVPGPFAGLHQERNARFLADHGAAVIIDDAALAQQLFPTVEKLFNAPEQLKSMSDAMRALADPRAAEKIVALLESMERQ